MFVELCKQNVYFEVVVTSHFFYHNGTPCIGLTIILTCVQHVRIENKEANKIKSFMIFFAGFGFGEPKFSGSETGAAYILPVGFYSGPVPSSTFFITVTLELIGTCKSAN